MAIARFRSQNPAFSHEALHARYTDSTLYDAGGVTEGDRGEGKGKPMYPRRLARAPRSSLMRPCGYGTVWLTTGARGRPPPARA